MPSDPYQDHFLIIKDDTGERKEPLNESRYLVGRDAECDIRLISQFVSRYHATIEQQVNPDGTCTYHIKDGDQNGKPSANGLLIDGRRMRSHDLSDRDEVKFGPEIKITYHLLRRDAYATVPPDEFDITLINPGTAELDNSDE